MWPHLNFADFKATREVSWDFFDKITSYKAFKNSSVLIVTKKSVAIPHLFDKNTSMTKTWYGIQIEVDLPLDVLDKIRHILENVHFVCLLSSLCKSNTDNTNQFRNESYAKFIAGVLSSTPKLTCLRMDVRLLENDLTTEVWSCPIIRHHLKNLESLELPHLGRQNHVEVYGTPTCLWETNLGQSEFPRNIEQLETTLLATPPTLKTLRLSKYLIDYAGYWGNPQQRQGPPISTSLLNLFRSHRESLEEVSIPVNVWKSSSDDIRTVTMPHLRSLTATVSPAGSFNFGTFLINHPKLEELDVGVLDLDFDICRDRRVALWEAIKRHCTGNAVVKKLHLRFSEWFFSSSGAKDDWSFLEGMKAMIDFQLVSTFGWLECGFRLLETLSRNQKLERLSLQGMHVAGGFWRFHYRDEIVSRETPLAKKLELLRGFRSLKRLSFRRCPNAVDDDVIQFIFREMTSLEELEVSHCPRLTDVGISGTGHEGEELVSIQSLQGQPSQP